ncbi:MAG: hypothetical protein FWD51_02655 [Betaproteobacteria bacterium]|nr:hypothetical protein [Betaproteobacteria bacterium]
MEDWDRNIPVFEKGYSPLLRQRHFAFDELMLDGVPDEFGGVGQPHPGLDGGSVRHLWAGGNTAEKML